MQRVRLLRRIENISVLGDKAVLQRKLSTTGESANGNEIPSSTKGYTEEHKKILPPLAHIVQVPGKHIRSKLAHAFNYWFKAPEDKLVQMGDMSEYLHNASLLIDDIQDNAVLRRGIPAAHKIYGVSSTINAAKYGIVTGMKKVLSLDRPDATEVFTELVLDALRGQEMDIYWRDAFICPSVEEYKEIVKRKTGALFTCQMKLIQLYSKNKDDFSKLTEILGLYFQIRDDYCNLCLQEYSQKKGYCDDLTEGKFSFPIIHAIKSRPDDTQVLDILRQRTHDLELKKRCVALLEKFGSFSYTRDYLEELDAALGVEVAKHGGNPKLEAVLDELRNWKWMINEKSSEQ